MKKNKEFVTGDYYFYNGKKMLVRRVINSGGEVSESIDRCAYGKNPNGTELNYLSEDPKEALDLYLEVNNIHLNRTSYRILLTKCKVDVFLFEKRRELQKIKYNLKNKHLRNLLRW